MLEHASRPVWRVPQSWQRIDVLSDLHLHPGRPRTLAGLLTQVADSTNHADALIILGDLFEAWIGDDSLDDPADSTGRQVAQALAQASTRITVALMHGNRDFLLGEAFLKRSGARLLQDPTVLELRRDQRWLLSHGDALCLSDTAYQAFRAQVRDPAWQAQVLALPLAQRRALAERLRQDSQVASRRSSTFSDVDPDTAIAWLRAAGAQRLLHGHTHRPGDEAWPGGLGRIVLSDWELDPQTADDPARAELMSLQRNAQGTWQAQRVDRRPPAPRDSRP